MEVFDTIKKLRSIEENTMEYHFAEALKIFWPRFEALLRAQAKPIMTFNRAFLQMGESGINEPIGVPTKVIRPFTHLLVDEFQDISPQIVSWLKANQRRLKLINIEPSIMAIGDDWQSIYGWRGSAPEIFTQFGKHFKSHPEMNGHTECRMMVNYRSIEPVIKDAERLLEPVKVKIPKESKAVKLAKADDHGVKLIAGVDLIKGIDIVVDEIVSQLKWVRSLESPDKNKVLVLSRKNSPLKDVKSRMSVRGVLDSDVKFYTFHGSKGLQGEVAVLLDNCDYNLKHTFRNAVYKASGIFSQSYDDAAKDEALRLAYVAVTRGVRRVIWFVNKPEGSAEIFKDDKK